MPRKKLRPRSPFLLQVKCLVSVRMKLKQRRACLVETICQALGTQQTLRKHHNQSPTRMMNWLARSMRHHSLKYRRILTNWKHLKVQAMTCLLRSTQLWVCAKNHMQKYSLLQITGSEGTARVTSKSRKYRRICLRKTKKRLEHSMIKCLGLRIRRLLASVITGRALREAYWAFSNASISTYTCWWRTSRLKKLLAWSPT